MSGPSPADRLTITVHGQAAALTRVDATQPASPWPVPCLLLHGWGVDSSLMAPIAERLSRLGHTCYLPDFPGFGASPEPPGAWGVPDYAAWTLGLLDALALDRVNLFAHSFGARVSLVLGAEQATRLDKIALTGAAGVPSRQPPAARARLAAYKAARGALRTLGASGLADQLAAWYRARYGSADFQAAQGVMRETFLKVVNHDIRPFAARTTRPTLLLWGEADDATPLWQGRTLEQLIPDAGLITYPGDHYAYLHHAADVCRTLDHFYRH